MGSVWLPDNRSRLREVLAAVALPALATAGLIVPNVGITIAALVYVLAVAAAALVGGLASGLISAVLSFVGLHAFFTPPSGLGMPKPADLLALLTFLVVSVVIGAMVSTVVSQRIRTERSAEEARLMHRLSAGLLSGRGLDDVLRSFAATAIEVLGLGRLSILTQIAGVDVVATPPTGSAEEGRVEEFAMTARGRAIGSIVVWPAHDRSWADDERRTMRTFADQLALALDDVRVSTQVEHARSEAAANKATAALFSSVTHDLRTPLASILASATSLRDLDPTFDATDRRVLLDAICDEADRLNRSVGQILEMSKIRAGALRPDRVPASMEDIVGGVVGRLEHIIGAHEVILDVDPDLPDVAVDVLQMERVIANLVENAAKFSPAGTPIEICGRSVDGRVRFEVADHGPGIAPVDRQRVFEPFEGLSDERSSGAGLGLAICRAIVDAHEGEIRIDESPLPGTRVVLELPEAPVT